MNQKRSKTEYVVCIKNEGYEASLELRKIYQVISDKPSEAHHLIRVIDEDGEDYLFPQSFFAPITLSASLAKALDLVA